jgi:thiosulfate dehydrogenase
LKAALLATAVALLAPLLACDGGPQSAAERGRELFADPELSPSQFNAFSCATCHRVVPDGDTPPRIAVTLYDSAFRASWWGGFEPRLIDAVNACYVMFMRGGQGLDEADERGRALYEYLVSISPGGPLPMRPMTVVENVTTVPRGDPARGGALYDAVCRPCHGDPHTGYEKLGHVTAIIPESSIAFAEQQMVGDVGLVVTEKVRHGQSFGIGGSMPAFTREALGDEDLGAILAYLGI